MLPIGTIILWLGTVPIPDGWANGLEYNDAVKNYCHAQFFKLIGLGYQNDFKCLIKVK